MGKTLWWRYTPSVSGRLRATTAGSGYDTVLAAYSGSAVTGLTSLGCDDDGAGTQGGTSVLELNVVAGQTYHFQVGGWRDTTGTVSSGATSFQLTIPSTSDQFAGATTVPSVPYTQSGVGNAQAGVESGERSPSCASVGKTVWWRYTPTADVTVTADTAGSGFDTVLGVWRGTSLGSLVEVGCDDDGGGAASTSTETVSLQAGNTYYFQVGGYQNTAGQAANGSITFRIR
jgi:hypothetical protein